MLLRLLMRDLKLNGRMLLVSYGLFGAFQAYFVLRASSTRAWLVFAAIYAAFLSVSVFAREDKFEATAWTCTLPVSRHDIVRARFAEAWLLVLAALAGATVLAALLPGSAVTPRRIFEPETLLLTATAVSLVVALVLPFLIRFGLLGLLVFLVGAQLLGAGLLVTATAIRRRGGEVRLGLSTITDAVGGLHAAMPRVAFAILVLVVLAAINWLGYRLAAHLFVRREL